MHPRAIAAALLVGLGCRLNATPLHPRAEVVVDDRAVPHIFAATEMDAYRALGYAVAKDRLFQLELQLRATAGTLTELLGPAALETDRQQRALALGWAAERTWAEADSTAPAVRAAQAYADGINAWIDRIRPADYPVEYRTLRARPMRWRPVYAAYLLNRMGWTLAYNEAELAHLQVRALVGVKAAEALFPRNSPIQLPIQPVGRSGPRFEFIPLPPPEMPDTAALKIGEIPSYAHPDAADALGSNNWAVSARRTAAGRALLAGDPHLELTLPSIWYEAHLVVPGTLDVYGATIPGIPGVVIGFNRDVAWSFTNTDADVADFYRETVNDTRAPTAYRLDGAWRALERRVEVYRDPGGAAIHTDTIYHTHRGPMRRAGGGWLSLRWTVLDRPADQDLGALLDAARARTVTDWLRRTAAFAAPAQNGVAADRTGTIAIHSTGRFPIRPGNRSGLEIRDGSKRSSDWRGYWPPERYPSAVNPLQGYLASANQQPVDPRLTNLYLGADWVAPWRAMRINELLRADSAVTPDAMRRYQTDPHTPRAEIFVPAFIAAARDREGRDGKAADAVAARAAALLAGWDRRYTVSSERAILFELAMTALAARTWDELIPPGAVKRGPVATPSEAVLAGLLRDSASVWWDDRRTPAVERRDEILCRSLRAAYIQAREAYGDPDRGGWRWSRHRSANILHLLGTPRLSVLNVPSQGGTATLNPVTVGGTHGASWRMVVELAPEVRGWTTYPGGQSGNPKSARYADRIPEWAAGKLSPVLFPRTPSSIPAARRDTTLEPYDGP